MNDDKNLYCLNGIAKRICSGRWQVYAPTPGRFMLVDNAIVMHRNASFNEARRLLEALAPVREDY